jgi:tetratricopeptide (TPR) repeat protein
MLTLILKAKQYLAIPLIAALALFIYIIQYQVVSYKGIEQKIEEFMSLPKGEYLKPAVMGFEQIAADIIWLRAIQVIGEDTVTPKGYDWIYHALDVVTTLDPKFAYAYQLGGVTLSVLGKAPEKSNTLLLKGMRENPEIWQIPFYIGFNNFFYLNDYGSAAEYMAKASELPGHPAYLPKLAARLYVQAGDPDVALEFLLRMYKETADEKVRATLGQRIKEVIVERDAKFLEEAIKRYKDVYKAYPERLIELVERGIITELPHEPLGGYYYFNPEDGRVYSSVVKERMRVYGKQ